MKLIGRTLLILIAFLSHYYISGSLNVKSILSQISKGDLTKEDVIKFYNKDFDPMLEFHKIFTPCLNHLIDQEMKTESFITQIIQSIKEFFSSSYQEYSIPDLGMKVKCETYINKLVSPEFIEKKKAEVLDLKRKLLASAQPTMKFRSKEESAGEAKNPKDTLPLPNANQHQKYSPNNKLKNNDIKIENNKELNVAKLLKGDNIQFPDLNGAEKIEYQINPEKLLKNAVNKNKENKTKNKDSKNSSVCEINLKKQKDVNHLLNKEKDLLQQSLNAKSLEFAKIHEENCKCTEAKNKLDTELTQCKKEKTDLQITNTKEKSKDDLKKFIENNPTAEEAKKELNNKVAEIQKLTEENIKCKHELEDAKKVVSDTKVALQAQKTLGEKLLKENSDKLFEEKDKLAKELKACVDKADKKTDLKDKKAEKCAKEVADKEAEIKKLSESLKTCNEKNANAIINNKNNQNNNNNNNIAPAVRGTVNPLDPRIKNDDVVDIRHEPQNRTSNNDLAEISKKLKTCEDKNTQNDSTIIDLTKKVTEAQEKMNILISKIDKETTANLEKEGQIKKLQEENNTKSQLYATLKETCDKNAESFEAQKAKLIEESKSLNTQVTECTKRKDDLQAKEKSCSEKLTTEISKGKELQSSKKALEAKCNEDNKRNIEESAKFKKELFDTGFNHNKTMDDFNAEKNRREKCEEINKQIISTSQKKCESRLQKIKEEYDFIVKDVKQLYENLNNSCTKEKKDLNDKISKVAKDLSTCEVNSLRKFNEKKTEAEKCQTDLAKEKEDKSLNFVKKAKCDSKIKSAESEKTKLDSEIKALKEQKACPLCPPCKENALAKEIETLNAKVVKLELSKKELDSDKKKLANQNALLDKSIMDTEKKCKEDLDKATKDLVSKVEKEKTECKKITAQLDLDKKMLLERSTKLSASEEKCSKDLDVQKQSCVSKDLLDKCLTEQKKRGETIGALNASIDKCQKEFKESLNKNQNWEKTEKETLKKIEGLEKQLQSKADEAEKIRKDKADKESECSDLLFELKSKLLSQSNDLESIRSSVEAKKTLIESLLKNLNNEGASDKKQMENFARQMDQQIKIQKTLNEQLIASKKTSDDLKKKKAEMITSVVNDKAKLSAADLKKMADDIKIKDKNIKTNKDLIKKQELNINKTNAAIGDLNSKIAVVEYKLKNKEQEKTKIENLLKPYSELAAKLKALIEDNKTLMTKYSKKAEIVLKEAVKTGSANEKFEKTFADYQQKLAGLEAIIANTDKKFQDEFKIISDKANEQNLKCAEALSAANSAKDAKCFNELKPVLEAIQNFNKNIVSGDAKVNNNNNNNIKANTEGLLIESQQPIDVNKIAKNSTDLDSCLNLISNKTFTENNCALLEPLRAKYNDLCRVNQLAPPNKDVMTFATQAGKDGNKSMLKRLNTNKF